MSSFNSLPNEITLKIIQALSSEPKSLGQIRLVSRSFNDLASPVLFSRFKIDYDRYKLQWYREITLELEAGSTRVFKHITELDVSMELYTKRDDAWFKWVDAMIPTMDNLRNISWKWSALSSDSEWVNGFVGKVGSLTHLKSFSLEIQNNPPVIFSLEPLSGLQGIQVLWDSLSRSWPRWTMKTQMARLISRCPDLESFTFTSIWPSRPNRKSPGQPITLADFFAEAVNLDAPLKLRELELRAVIVTPADFRSNIHHFRYLERLELGWDPDPTAAANFGEICSILQAEQIHLKTIYGIAIHPPAVLDYLSSYSGAENITLKPEHPLDDSPRLVNRFFSSVLSNHCHSLKSLDLGANKITAWSKPLSENLLSEVERCQRLQELSLWLYIPGETRADLEVLVRWLEIVKRLSCLRKLTCLTIAYKTGRYLFGEFDDVIDPDKRLQKYMEQFLQDFMQEHPSLSFEVSTFHRGFPD